MTESRRDFLRRAARRTVTTTVIGTVSASSIVGMVNGVSYEGNDATISPNPLKKEDASTEQQTIPCTDVSIAGIPIKLCGVWHSRSFTSEHYDHLEELVRHASVVVSESNPKEFNRKGVTHDFQAHFGTVYQFCQSFGKSVVSLDPLSMILGVNLEIFIEGFGGAIYSSIHASDLWKKNQKPTSTRKELLKTALGFYFFASAYAPGGLQLQTWFSGEGEEGFEKLVRRQRFSYNHIIDQRNVELTTRLQDLHNIVPSEEFAKGEYVLVIFGKGHTLGMEYYLKHPIIHKLKSALYAPTYGLVGSNEIALYVPDGKNNWTEKVLE